MEENEIVEIEINERSLMNQVLHLAVDMGETLLSNGAEIFRVEETIEHVCHAFDVRNFEIFILSNGIFVTAEEEGQQVFAKIKHIPLSSTHLGIVTAVNNLSREISAREIGLVEAGIKLDAIRQTPPKKNYFRILAAGLGAACFCYLLGGNLGESIFTFGIGMLVYVLVLFSHKHNLSKMIPNILGGAMITILAIGVSYIKLPFDIDISRDSIIIGSIMPLIPGLAFMNAIRDIADSNFISGTVRIIDALLVFVYIAIGVGSVLSIYSYIIGGLMK